MPASTAGWRIALVSDLPVDGPLFSRLRQLGHDPVAWVRSGRPSDPPPRAWGRLGDRPVHTEINPVFAPARSDVAPLLSDIKPDLMLCWGFPWRLPQEALDVARLRSVNQHFGQLPRHRGPNPLAWALRDGDDVFGVTWHGMDSSLDTGPILAQRTVPIADDDCTLADVWPKLSKTALDLLPRALARIAADDSGDPQPSEDVTWAGPFGKDYASVDWAQSARKIHDQVRAWQLVTGRMRETGPIAGLDGRSVRLLRTSLTDPGDGRAIECGDGPLWIREYEPLD
jgi:methionyl-tRNA formyltransferase